MVRLSHTVISLAPCCPGDTVTSSVFVNNVSNTEQVRHKETCSQKTPLYKVDEGGFLCKN